MATYSATRVVKRFYEYISDSADEPGDTFNIDATPHYELVEDLTFDSVRELAGAMRRDGVTFTAGDGAEYADLPDGSHIIDYSTAERESCYWDCGAIDARILDRVLIPAVDSTTCREPRA